MVRGRVSMNPIAAIAFQLCALSLWLVIMTPAGKGLAIVTAKARARLPPPPGMPGRLRVQVEPAAEPEGGCTVQAMDLRFGSPPAPAFVATAILNSRLDVVRAGFTFGASRLTTS